MSKLPGDRGEKDITVAESTDPGRMKGQCHLDVA